MGYYFLGKDWLETAKKWREDGVNAPPVMITVTNLTHTAARVQYAFEHKRIRIEELCDPAKILHIDSKVLDEAEAQEEPAELFVEAEATDETNEETGEDTAEDNGDAPKKKLTKKERAERLRKTVDTIGREGQPGEQIQNVISVGMLSEGWDAKTVTHIMGLRAFTSQLLCEQVVGRGLLASSRSPICGPLRKSGHMGMSWPLGWSLSACVVAQLQFLSEVARTYRSV
jgi:type III restriction enzyme